MKRYALLMVGGLGLFACESRCGEGAIGGDGFCYVEAQEPSVSSADEIAAADINADGFIDLALLIQGEQPKIELLLNSANGTLTERDIPLTALPTGIAVSDIDADGDLDLLVGQSSKVVSIFSNDGAANFIEALSIPINEVPETIATADLDGNLSQDIVVGTQGILFSGGLHTFLQSGADFTLASSQPLSIVPLSLRPSDFDLDGDQDVEVEGVGLLSSETLLVDNLGAGLLGEPVQTAISGFLSESIVSATGDLDGDTIEDTVLVRESFDILRDTPIELQVKLSGHRQDNVKLLRSWKNDSFIRDLTLSDLNGDAKLDSLVLLEILEPEGATLSRLFIVENQGNGRFGEREEIELTFKVQESTTADINNDGRLDLLFLDEAGALRILRSTL